MTTTQNYAEALESEAYQIARQRLIIAAERAGTTAYLDGWLANLDRIHARNMAAAAEWTPPAAFPGRRTAPYDLEHLSQEVVLAAARSRAAKAQQEDPS